MIENKKKLLSFDITDFKSSKKKIRTSHLSLFKVAMHSFERGDLDTAQELFNKLESDSFLPEDAKKKVKTNIKDIDVIIKTGKSKSKKKADLKKEATSEIQQDHSYDTVEDTEATSNASTSQQIASDDVFPTIKEAMTTFAEKLAESLQNALSGISAGGKSNSELKEKQEEDIELSPEKLDEFKDIDMEGSINDIYKKEFNSDLNVKDTNKDLSEDDINRFLNVGTQLSETVPDFIESMNEMKQSIENLSKEVPEINKISENIKESLDDIDKQKKQSQIDKLNEELIDDEEYIEKKKREHHKQSDFLEDYENLEEYTDNTGESVPLNKLSEDELGGLFKDDIAYSNGSYEDSSLMMPFTDDEDYQEYIQNKEKADEHKKSEKDTSEQEELETEKKENTDLLSRLQDKNQNIMGKHQQDYSGMMEPKEYEQELYDKERFVRSTASEISKQLRKELSDMSSSMKNDNQYDNNEIKKELDIAEDTYDQQMPPVRESDIELPTGENNKYMNIDPAELDGNIEKILQIKLLNTQEKFINKLIDIENEINDLMDSSDEDGEVEDLSKKLEKIKAQERLEKISQQVEKDMVINYTTKQKEINDEESDELITEKPTEDDGTEKSVSEESTHEIEKDTSEQEITLSTKFVDTQENLGKTLDKLSEVLEKSFGKFMETFEEKGELPEKKEHKAISETDEQEIEEEVKEKPKTETKKQEQEIEEEVKEKPKTETKKQEQEIEEEEEDYFIADEEVIVKQQEKKKKPRIKKTEAEIKAEEEEKLKQQENQVLNYPDLEPTTQETEEEKEFVTLDEVLEESEMFDSEEFTLEDLKREEGHDKKIPGLDPHFMSGAYIPYDEYKQKDGTFTDIEGKPILAPEEDDSDNYPDLEEEEENFIEKDAFTIERPELEDEEEEEELPEDIPDEIVKKKKKKPEPIKLTYNFKDLFHNKTYLKYREILNEAAQLVSEKKLDEALEYYNVILDQNIPKAFKLMIQQNIDDITQTIIDTFRRSDTIVNVKSSGEIKRVKTEFQKNDEE